MRNSRMPIVAALSALSVLGLLAWLSVANAAPKVAMIEVKGMVCSA